MSFLAPISRNASGFTFTASTIFGHIALMDDNADAKRILSTLPPEDWRRPRGRPTSHGWAPYSRIVSEMTYNVFMGTINPPHSPYSRISDPTISHCLKQWIRPRTGLCGGCGRRTALHDLELHARNDDDDCDSRRGRVSHHFACHTTRSLTPIFQRGRLFTVVISFLRPNRQCQCSTFKNNSNCFTAFFPRQTWRDGTGNNWNSTRHKIVPRLVWYTRV